MFAMRIDEGLELRLLEQRHARALYDLTTANRAHLRPYLPWVDKLESVRGTEAFIRSGLEQFARGDGFQAGIYHRGALAGMCGLHYIRPDTRRTEIGYWLAEAAQGQGIVTRVCAGLCAYAFEELGLHRVEIRCHPGNARSRAVPERLGFTEEGILRGVDKLASGWADWVVYGLLEDEWRARNGAGAVLE
ncbi:GCN5-related N-acetyltransferase [Truepera radiovictrix DSM 17093]|uniref:GCN5-related N-acetyltransferase n=2 Tax=Truepera TaxID=332248 RepID=D7CU74_TRURR|nr:GCN5-related N-acetyltransferase [Truepera radiovictrix DSM 17093]